jgi:hypothetical protein
MNTKATYERYIKPAMAYFGHTDMAALSSTEADQVYRLADLLELTALNAETHVHAMYNRVSIPAARTSSGCLWLIFGGIATILAACGM